MTELTPAITKSWRKFLLTEEGRDGMLFLREKTPGVSVGDSHNIIFQAGRAEGFKSAVDTISEILTMPATKDIKIENE